MASCTQIDNLLQAYIDNELGHSERVILQEHLAECSTCREMLRRHRRSSALIFESFSEFRLSRDLTKSVLENLPEMEFPPIDVAVLNRRTKHPALLREKVFRWMPIAAAVLLVILAGVIKENWPNPAVSDDMLGVVTFSEGFATRIAPDSEERTPAKLKSFAFAGERYETGGDSQLMLTLVGPTELRLNENSRVLIHHDRKIRVEKGQVLLNVGKGKRLFKVLTPNGDITVFGTTFDVKVNQDQTTIVVEEGEVLVELENESLFGILKRGQQVDIVLGQDTPLVPKRVDVAAATRWARRIVADEEAKVLFTSKILPRHKSEEATGESVYRIRTNGQTVKSIVLEWEPSMFTINHCAYDVYVYTFKDEPLFKGRIPRHSFTDMSRTQFEIVNTNSGRADVDQILVKLVPDYSEGGVETVFKECKATLGR